MTLLTSDSSPSPPARASRLLPSTLAGSAERRGGLGEEGHDRRRVASSQASCHPPGNVSQPTITVNAGEGQDTGAAVIIAPAAATTSNLRPRRFEICDGSTPRRHRRAEISRAETPGRRSTRRPCRTRNEPSGSYVLARSQLNLTRRIGIWVSLRWHLAAAACNNFDKRTYAPVDDADMAGADFAFLIYPAYRWGPGATDFPELPITNTPQTFLVMTQDDSVRGCALFYACAQAGEGPQVFLTDRWTRLRPAPEPARRDDCTARGG